MNDLITTAAGKLDDPIMIEWAIHYYCDLPKCDVQRRTAIEETWFHELRLAQWLGSDEVPNLPELLQALPRHRLKNVSHLLSKHWRLRSSYFSSLIITILAEISPDEPVRLYREAFEQLDRSNNDDLLRFSSADKVLTDPADPQHRELAEKLVEMVLAWPDRFTRSMMFSTLLQLNRLLTHGTLLSVLEDALTIETQAERRQGILKGLFDGWFGRYDYLTEIFEREEYDSELELVNFAPFFKHDAPLAQFDQWLRELPKLDDVLPVLQALAEQSEPCRSAIKLLNESPSVSEQLSEKLRTQTALAACLHAYTNNEPDFSALDLTAILDLLALDMREAYCKEQLIEHLKPFDQAAVSNGIIERLEDNADTYAGVHVADAMAVLRYPEFIEPLIDALESSLGDFLHESALKALTEIGGGAQAALIERWDSLDSSQQIFGLGVITAVGGQAAGEFAAVRFSELLADEVEFACDLVLHAPDRRLLELLQAQVHRKQMLIDRAFYILARLFDKDGAEVERAKASAMEEIVRSKQMDQFLSEGELPRDDYLSLELACPVCGDRNKYRVKRVIVGKYSDSDKAPDFLLADEFPCASCNAYVEFEFTPMAQMTVSAEMIRVSIAAQEGTKQEPLVKPLNCILAGRSIPVSEALVEVRSRLALRPGSAKDWSILGNLLSLLNRPKAALEARRKAAQLAPTAADAQYALADLLTDIGLLHEAFDVLQQALNCQNRWTFLLPHGEFQQEFAELYNYLRKELGLIKLPLLSPSALNPSQKTGRNDPCPCGSGKKYKKCCGG